MVRISEDFFSRFFELSKSFLIGVFDDLVHGVDASNASLYLWDPAAGELVLSRESGFPSREGRIARSRDCSRTRITVSIEVFGVPRARIELRGKMGPGRFKRQDAVFASALARYAGRVLESAVNASFARQTLADDVCAEYNYDRIAMRGKIAATVAHQINNPLDGVLRYVNMLLNYQILDEEKQDSLLRIRDGVHRMAEATRSILSAVPR